MPVSSPLSPLSPSADSPPLQVPSPPAPPFDPFPTDLTPAAQPVGWWPAAVVLAGIIMLLFAAGVGELQLDAPMYGFIAKRVAATGEWSTLYYDWDGQYPYFNKPPVVFWLTALVMKVLGQTILATRIVPALMFIAAALLLQRVVRRQYGDIVAWSAAGILLVQREVLGNVLEVRLDGALLFAAMIAALGAVRLLEGTPKRLRAFAWVGLGIGIGYVSRGGLILMTLPVVAISLACRQQWKTLFHAPGWAMLLLIAALIAGPWYAWETYRWSGAFATALYKDSYAQHFNSDPRGFGFLATYYARRLPEMFALWLLPALAGAVVLFLRRRNGKPHALGPVDTLGTTWIVVCFVLIHFTTMRAPQYLLQCFPWLSVLAAVGLCHWSPFVSSTWRRWGPVVLPVLASVIVGITVWQGHRGKGIAAQTLPELQTLAVAAARPPGSTPPPAPVVWVTVSDQQRNEWQRFCVIQFHTGLRTIRATPTGPPPNAQSGDYWVVFNDRKAEVDLAKTEVISKGNRMAIYRLQ